MNDAVGRLGASAPNLEQVRALRSYVWGRVLLVGLGLWTLAVVIALTTGTSHLVPAVVVLGSLAVPVSYLVWAQHRPDRGELTLSLLLRAFMAAGVFGTVTAAVLPTYFLAPSPLLYTVMALVEELGKLVVLGVVAHTVRERTLRTGLVLGASVGFGFGAFQTLSYGLQALVTVDGMTLREVVETELLRGVLAPVGHALWTAILAGVLFAASRDEKWRFTLGVFFTGLGVAALQALWDAAHNAAVVFTLLLTGTVWETRLLDLGYLPRATDVQVHLFTAATFVGHVLVGAVSLLWFGVLTRRLNDPEPTSSDPTPEAAGVPVPPQRRGTP